MYEFYLIKLTCMHACICNQYSLVPITFYTSQSLSLPKFKVGVSWENYCLLWLELNIVLLESLLALSCILSEAQAETVFILWSSVSSPEI